MKRCNFCDRVQPLTEFYRHSQPYGDGYVTKCKTCYREYARFATQWRREVRKPEKIINKELLVYRARPSTFNMTPREARNQRVAMFEATLSKFRRELNLWWSATGGGDRECPASMLLSLRRLAAKAADDEQAIGR